MELVTLENRHIPKIKFLVSLRARVAQRVSGVRVPTCEHLLHIFPCFPVSAVQY